MAVAQSTDFFHEKLSIVSHTIDKAHRARTKTTSAGGVTSSGNRRQKKMALKILNPGIQPLGQFDFEDGYLSSVKGGEICTLVALSRTNTATEKAAADVLDGYTNYTQSMRVGLTLNVAVSTARPLWLTDDGTSGYGTLFGQVIGIPAGLSTTGTNLGPHTASGSGKVTAWDKPGLYGVTLDAVDTSVSLGLLPSNTSLVPQSRIYPTILGVLTPTQARSVDAAGPVVARFVEFESTARSLVRTPASLVGAATAWEHAVISYFVE